MSNIIEITTLKQLFELSSMGGGAVQGHSGEDKMIKREEIIAEQMLRSYIRESIKNGITLDKTINIASKLRAYNPELGICLMGYLNNIFI